MNKIILSLALFTLAVNSSVFCMEFVENKSQKQEKLDRLPIVFHEEYDILPSLQKIPFINYIHPFDTAKYGKIHKYLKTTVPEQIKTYTPHEVTDEQLEKVHSKEYIQKFSSWGTSVTMARIAEAWPLVFIPNLFIRRKLLRPMRLATAGTVLAARKALEFGMAVNLSGGYHHAKKDSGGGFCVFADIPLAAYTLLDEKKVKKVMVVDLDAHQGNGHESIFGGDPTVPVFDAYNPWIYPQDTKAAQHIKYPVALYASDDNFNSIRVGDDYYLNKIKEKLPNALDQEKPGLIIYNAGTDIYEKDQLGDMAISEQGIIDRDALVFNLAKEREIPIAMVLSGGYTQESAGIIGKSLESIINTYY